MNILNAIVQDYGLVESHKSLTQYNAIQQMLKNGQIVQITIHNNG